MQSIDPLRTARWIFSYGAVTISTHGFDSVNCPSIRLGTSAFTAAGWAGTFYPKNLKTADYLSFYAQNFDSVEVDSTFYGTPRIGTVRSWDAKTPSRRATWERIVASCWTSQARISSLAKRAYREPAQAV